MSKSASLPRIRSKARPASQRPRLVERELERAQQRIRTVDSLQSICLLAGGVLTYLLIIIGLDYWLRLGDGTRQILWSLAGIGALVFIGVRIVYPLIQRINPYYTARMIEKSMPSSKNGIINWLDLRDNEISPIIRDALSRRAVHELDSANMEQAIPTQKPMRTGIIIGIILLVLLSFAFFLPDQVGSLFKRALFPFKPAIIPTHTRLEVIRPINEPVPEVDVETLPLKEVQVERGQPVEFQVISHGQPPAEVLFESQTAGDKQPIVKPMRQDKKGDSTQPWRVALSSSDIPVDGFLFWFRANDGLTRKFKLVVVSRIPPSVSDLEVRLNYPAYTKRRPAIQGMGPIKAIEGTKVEILVTADRAASSGELEVMEEQTADDGKIIPIRRQTIKLIRPAGVSDDNKLALAEPLWLIPGYFIKDDKKQKFFYQLALVSPENLTGISPKYPLEVIPDLAPRVEIKKVKDIILDKKQDEFEVEANAVVPFAGQAHDDIAMGQVSLKLKTSDGRDLYYVGAPAAEKNLQKANGFTPPAVNFLLTLDLAKLTYDDNPATAKPITLKPGTIIEAVVEGSDTAEPKAHIGTSQLIKLKLKGEANQEERKKQEKQAGDQQEQHEQEKKDKQQQQPENNQNKDEKNEDKSNDKTGDKSNEKTGDKSNEKTGDKSNEKTGDKSNEKTGDKSNEKTGDKSNEKTGDKSNEKTGDKSNEKTGDKSNEKTGDKSNEKTGDKSNEKTGDKSNEKTGDKSNEKTGDKSNEKTGDKSNEKTGDKSNEKTGDKSNEKTGDKSNEKTGDKSNEKTGDKSNEKTGDKSNEKTGDKSNEKTGDKSNEKTGDKSNEKTGDKSNEKTGDKSNEKTGEKSNEKTGDKSNEKTGEKSNEKTGDKSNEKTGDKSNEKTGDKSNEKTGDKSNEKTGDKSNEKTGEKSNEKTGDKSNEKTGDKSNEKTGDKSNEKTGDKSNEKTGDKSNEKTGDKSNEKTGDKSNEKTGDKSNEKTGDKSNEKTGDKSNEKTGNKSNEKTGEKSNEKTGDKSNEKTGDKPNDMTGDKPGDKPGDKSKDQSKDLAKDKTGNDKGMAGGGEGKDPTDKGDLSKILEQVAKDNKAPEKTNFNVKPGETKDDKSKPQDIDPEAARKRDLALDTLADKLRRNDIDRRLADKLKELKLSKEDALKLVENKKLDRVKGTGKMADQGPGKALTTNKRNTEQIIDPNIEVPDELASSYRTFTEKRNQPKK